MAKRRPGRPRKRKAPTYRLGKASSLPGPLWSLWLDHVWKLGPTWAWTALMLSHALCLRISEVLQLRAEDFRWKAKTVSICALKGHPRSDKPLLRSMVTILCKLKTKGCKRKRQAKKGARGTVIWNDQWEWPQTGYLFPSKRLDAKLTHRVKDTICKRISVLRKSFKPPQKLVVDQGKIRSHSGRHRMINDMKSAEVAEEVAMKFARIKDRRTFLGYGELTDEQAGRTLQSNQRLRTSLKRIYKSKH